MLSTTSYIKYLESVALSLLAARPNPEADIPITDSTSIMAGYEVSPISLREEIQKHRSART